MIADLKGAQRRALFSFVRSVDDDDDRRLEQGKHKRFGGSRVVQTEDGQSVCSGGAFNSNDGARVAYGFTKQDISDAVTVLRRAGFTDATEDDVEGLLFEARVALDDPAYNVGVRVLTDEQKARMREYRRELTKRRRAEGLCLACGLLVDVAGNATCYACGVRANESKRKRIRC